MRSVYVPIGTLMLTSILWGSAWLPLKALNRAGADGISLILVSYSILFLLSLKFTLKHASILRRKGHLLAAIAVLGGSANLCFSYALIYGDVIRVMVLFYLLPVWGVLGGRFILHEHTNHWRWLGVVLAVCGAFVLLGGPEALAQPPKWIDLIALGSGIFFAASNLLFRGMEDVPLAPKVSALFAGACVISAATLLMLDMPFAAVNPDFPWGYVVLYSATWLLLANVGSQWAVTQMPAGRSSIIIILELITAVLTAVFIAHEQITLAIILGGGLIVSATVIEVLVGDAQPVAEPTREL